MSVRAPWFYVALIPEGGKGELVNLTERVLSFDYEDHEAKTDKLKLTVRNFDLANFDDPVFRHGARLNVCWGDGVTVAPMREVIIRKVTGGIVLTVEADDRAVEMDREKKRRTFSRVTRSDVIRQLAVEAGYQEPDIEDTDEVFNVVTQPNITDAQLIRKLAHLEGFEFFVDFDGFHWHRRRTNQAPQLVLNYYKEAPRTGDILSFTVDNDITRKPGKVTVKSRNPVTKEDIVATADNKEDANRTALQQYIGLIDPETGNFTKQERVAQETTVGTTSNAPQTKEDAQREATARFRKASQTAVKMNLELRGIASLVAKSVVEISGLGKRLSGKYYLRVVSHSIDGSGGYTQKAELITDGYGRGFNSGRGKSDGSDASLAAVIARLEDEQSQILGDQTGDVQLDNALTALIRLIKTVAGSSGSVKVSNAKKAAGISVSLSQTSRKLGNAGVASACAEAAAVLRRITSVEDAKAEGNLNEKTEVAAGSKVAVQKINPETGDPVTVYVDKRGRDG